MEKIYLIMVGEYSDRHCVGYCTTKEEAERYCAVKNNHSFNDNYPVVYEIEEQECLDGNIDGKVTVGKSIKFVFERENGGWAKVWYDPDVEMRCEHKTMVIKRQHNVEVFVWQKEYDEDNEDDKAKAFKIATDALYHWYAEYSSAKKEFQERFKKPFSVD